MCLAATALAFSSRPASANGYTVTNLVSDGGAGSPTALRTDPNLINPWGMASSPTSPIWVSDNGSGKMTLYNGTTGALVPLVVTVPGAGTATGQVFNNTAAFNSDVFITSTEGGVIAGWRGALGTNAETLFTTPGAVYKGLAIDTASGHLYAANFNSGAIDVFGTALPGTFVDPSLPAGFAPFNIQNLGGTLFVTYAVQDGTKHDDVPGAGNGIVDAFDLNGNLLRRVTTGNTLNSPWGLALAPVSFGEFGGDLLVGNFGDGRINAFNPTTGAFLGQLKDGGGAPLTIDGLWGLKFGTGTANGGPAKTLFFTAGPNDEANGLFGAITVNAPEPGSLPLAATGALTLLGVLRARRRRHGRASA